MPGVLPLICFRFPWLDELYDFFVSPIILQSKKKKTEILRVAFSQTCAVIFKVMYIFFALFQLLGRLLVPQPQNNVTVFLKWLELCDKGEVGAGLGAYPVASATCPLSHSVQSVQGWLTFAVCSKKKTWQDRDTNSDKIILVPLEENIFLSTVNAKTQCKVFNNVLLQLCRYFTVFRDLFIEPLQNRRNRHFKNFLLISDAVYLKIFFYQ